MTQKVILAILDKDLKARTFKKFPLSSEGTKIDVVKAGKGYFMPKIDNESFIEFPRPWYLGGGWKRVYVAIRGSKACINFKTGDVKGPDPQQVIEAAKSDLIKNFGKEKQETPLIVYIMFAVNLLILLYVMGVIV